MLEEGVVPGPNHLMLTLLFANPNIVRAFAIAPGVMINSRASVGCVLFIMLLSFPLMYIIEFVVFDTQCSYYSHCHYRNLFFNFKYYFRDLFGQVGVSLKLHDI